MPERQTYQGQCHCGAVRFTATTDLGAMGDCNCSRCRRLGSIMQPVAEADFSLVSGADDLVFYHFNTHKIDHQFCRVCGIQAFSSGLDDKGQKTFMVSVLCLENVPPIDRNSITHWDGASW
ncbi:GFA family protein [Devosia submarina]|uniref:GFA family protein n=1 Tax=Devosia submarina TaxID=1173082 RepID=UPI0013002AC6|nr:GFA family protein [Devosia submarina]